MSRNDGNGYVLIERGIQTFGWESYSAANYRNFGNAIIDNFNNTNKSPIITYRISVMSVIPIYMQSKV